MEEGGTALRVSQPGDGAAPLVLSNLKAPKNGYAFIYLSNENDDPVYWDDFTVSYTRGSIIEENHYYAFGSRISGISSRKYDGGSEGSLKNDYLYQGDFAELDEDIGWHDFELRNYDAQICRWAEQDPFQQFASPYIGIGNNPVNTVDPSGGWAATGLFEGMSRAGIMATTTLGGAIVGMGIDLMSGGDGGKGLLYGALIGAGSNFADPLNILFDVFRTSIQKDQRIIRTTLVDLLDNLNIADKKLEKRKEKHRRDFENHFGIVNYYAMSSIKNMVQKEQNLVKEYLKRRDYKNKVSRSNKYPKGVFAWVYPNDPNHNVNLEAEFWKAGRRGADSRLGTLAHEFSHFNDIGSTQDYGYGVNNAKKFATPANSHIALSNADNFEYYIEKVKL